MALVVEAAAPAINTLLLGKEKKSCTVQFKVFVVSQNI